MEQGDLQLALAWADKSMHLAETLGSKQTIAKTFKLRGLIAYKLKQMAIAKHNFNLAVETHHPNDKEGLISCYDFLALIAEQRGRFDEAAENYSKSLALELEIGDIASAATSYGSLALMARHRNDLDAAEQIYRTAIKFCLEHKDRLAPGKYYHGLGEVLQMKSEIDNDEAVACFKESLRISETLNGDKFDIARNLYKLAEIAQYRSDFGEAMKKYRASLSLFEEIQDTDYVVLINKTIESLYGDTKESEG
jgi:tetratricopeptide (TPR) repeat protein